MNSRSLADFLFAGTSVLPGALASMGEVGLAIIVLVPLLIAACLCGWHEQMSDGGNGADRRPQNKCR